MRRRLLMALPAVGFAGLAAVFAWGISRDPNQLPSALIGKEVPRFDLPPVEGGTPGLASKDLYGEVSLVNVFASWCVACRVEHPLFMNLARDKSVPIHGLNYKDRPQDAAQWLNTLGDPYTRTGADRDGRVAIDWGVYGVPETFVVGADGRIAHKHMGPLTEQALRETILPLVERLRQQAKGGTS
nr:DsbE family thiol:disulfide interchange protein [Sinorhizobium fredii]